MPNNKIALYVHLVWATWDRAALITPEIERAVHRCIEEQAIKQGCEVIAINGMSDHLHLLVAMPPIISISDLVKALKGVSSRLINGTLCPETPFKWQGSYGAFTVSRYNVRAVRKYIRLQKQHHEEGSVVDEVEETVEANTVHPKLSESL